MPNNHRAGRLISRLHSLYVRRMEIEGKIGTEMRRPLPDSLRLQSLKRLKLRLKDEILQCKAALAGERKLAA